MAKINTKSDDAAEKTEADEVWFVGDIARMNGPRTNKSSLTWVLVCKGSCPLKSNLNQQKAYNVTTDILNDVNTQ